MARVGWRDSRAVQTFVTRLYAVRDLDEFSRHVVSALRRVVPCGHISYNEVDPRAGRNNMMASPAIDRHLQEVFERHIADHPLIRHYAEHADRQVRKISDFLTQRQFHQLGIYAEFFRGLGIEHQIALVLPSPPPLVVGIALNRDRPDFTEHERRRLEFLRPHMMQAYRNAQMVTRMKTDIGALIRGVEDVGWGVARLDADGRVSLMSARAVQCLRDYFKWSGRRLPDSLERWVRRHGRLIRAEEGYPEPLRPFVLERDGRRLVVRLAGDVGRRLLLFAEHTSPDPASLERFGLSRREAEVLAWVAEGKTNAEIAAILGTRPRTVGKHLERVYQKLGVETRTAAANVVLASSVK